MLISWFALFSLLPAALSAPVTNKEDGKCTNPAIRREWRSLDQSQRDNFHKAVKCLQDKPSKLNVDVSKTLYDDFSYVHYTINETIHHTSSFFPWHRYFLVLREEAMADCGYSDPLPYWDWTLDSSPETFKHSEMFDVEKGFGGDGTGKTDWKDGLCVEDGPYAGLHVNFPEPHCLTRQFVLDEQVFTNWTKSITDEILGYSAYLDFWNQTERHPHDNLHRTINGDLKTQYSSNEPLFFLLHAQVDRIWALWQGRNETRLHDYAGNTVQKSTALTASVNDMIDTLGFAPERDVASFMDTMANGLCYTYDDMDWKSEDDN